MTTIPATPTCPALAITADGEVTHRTGAENGRAFIEVAVSRPIRAGVPT